MRKFEKKVALVTGGSAGIGRATAIAFAREGAKVVIASRRTEESQETLRLVQEAGGDGIFVQTDVTREADIESLIGRIDAAYGRLDFASNNAGVLGESALLVDQTGENYELVMTGNVKSVLLSMKHELSYMLGKGSGVIVNNASVYGMVAFPTGSVYVASKHAVLGLTKAAALEVAPTGIRVNAVSPAVIRTEMSEKARLGSGLTQEEFAAGHPVGRIGVPEEIAGAVLFLCSDEAAFITGHSLAIDGGKMAQ
jgi:NAD(P)-dependent dehydrogenase (short-subunit alcohol dehydrogenase family)